MTTDTKNDHELSQDENTKRQKAPLYNSLMNRKLEERLTVLQIICISVCSTLHSWPVLDESVRERAREGKRG